MSSPYLGEIRMVPFSFAPTGWAMCNGQLLSKAQNNALFTLLGTTYGGDGITNFALPDFQERAPIHYGQGPGLTPYALGQSGGANGQALTPDQIAHGHTLTAISAAATAADPGGNSPAQASSSLGNAYHAATNLVAMAPDCLAMAGNDLPHENRPPYLAITFIIAINGVYPAR